MVSYAGSRSGFVPNVLHIGPRKTGDYRKDMNAMVFQFWFMKLMKNIPPNSTIVMDNESYPSVTKEKLPQQLGKSKKFQIG